VFSFTFYLIHPVNPVFKTTELTMLQVGDGLGPVNVIVSTLIEAENVLPLMLEYKAAGRAVSVSLPFPLSNIN
jgi:D-serine ammonia-lyase